MKLLTLVANTRLSISRTVMKSFRIRVIESYEGLPVQIRTENLSRNFRGREKSEEFHGAIGLVLRVFIRANFFKGWTAFRKRQMAPELWANRHMADEKPA